MVFSATDGRRKLCRCRSIDVSPTSHQPTETQPRAKLPVFPAVTVHTCVAVSSLICAEKVSGCLQLEMPQEEVCKILSTPWLVRHRWWFVECYTFHKNYLFCIFSRNPKESARQMISAFHCIDFAHQPVSRNQQTA